MRKIAPLFAVILLSLTVAIVVSQEPPIHHIVGTGQSLSVGGQSVAHTSASPDGHLALSRDRTAFLSPLAEPVARAQVQETHHSSMAAMIDALAPEHVTLHTAAGVGGCEYDCLKQDGTGDVYALSLAQMAAARDLALAAGREYVVSAVSLVHGEADHRLGTTTYYSDMLELQSDYQADAQALTGQSAPVPLFLSQMSSWTVYGSVTSTIPLDQLRAAVDSPGVVMVMPKYVLPYADDGLHLTWQGYQQMGEQYGKVYSHVVVQGQPWEPLRPLSVVAIGRHLYVRFHVPVPPLVLDTEHVTDPGAYGFEVWPPVSIESVQIVGPSVVRVTLDHAPAEETLLRYAYTGTPGAGGGPITGARGNLRDSDDTPSPHGYDMWNWCVHFDEPVRAGYRVFFPVAY